MKFKKGILLIAFTIIAIGILGVFTSVQAATTRTFNIRPNRMNLNSSGNMVSTSYEYQVTNKGAKVVYEIYDVADEDSNETFYCLRGGPGFGSTVMGNSTPVSKQYTNFTITNKTDAINNLPHLTSDTYKGILWVLSNSYVPPTTPSQMEQANKNLDALITAAENYVRDDTNYSEADFAELFYDDIDIVQQLAIWHFTNKTYKTEYDVGTNGLTLKYRLNSSETLGEMTTGRIKACDALYAYLTNVPSDFEYSDISSTSEPVEFASTIISAEVIGNRLVIGPYKLNKLDTANYTIEPTVLGSNGREITDVVYLDKDKNPLGDRTIADLGEEKFYISVPSNTDKTSIVLSLETTYFYTDILGWIPSNYVDGVDQPIVEVNKGKDTYTITKRYEEIPTPEEPKFDLSLRKFITAIERSGEPTNIIMNRTPEVTGATLQKENTTLEKKHIKTPEPVKTGDIVTYTIRVYNEGEVNGWATEITDYLPAGLEFIDDDSEEGRFNKDQGWEAVEGSNGKVIKNKLATNEANKLLVYDSSKPKEVDSKDIQIKCRVIATRNENGNLKNIAEITADKAEGEDIGDRDSTPGNVENDPTKYRPQDPTKGLGEEDDDDYEDLILETTPEQPEFDLALRKFITAIEREGEPVNIIMDRIPTISGATLQKESTTLEKKHIKTPEPVKTGDIVTYTIRVYNEGEVNGWATEITDYLPAGLEFIDDDSEEGRFNKDQGWEAVEGSNGKVIKNKLATNEANKLLVYDSSKPKEVDSKDIQIKCRVIATKNENGNLKNIAEITADKAEGEDIGDRDSTPGNVEIDPTKYNPQDPTKGLGEEDDDDYEDLTLDTTPGPEPKFDLALRKFITEVTRADGTKKTFTPRVPGVDVGPLKDGNETTTTTANYNHTKKPVSVEKGDIVTYTIRVYNEGEVDGYVTEIMDHLPPQLEFLKDDETNTKYGWEIVEDSDGRKVKTNITSNDPDYKYSATREATYKDRENKTLLKAFDDKEMTAKNYIDVKIKCKVKDSVEPNDKITNIAEITKMEDAEGNEIKTDRDSTVSNRVIPTDASLPTHKDAEIESGKLYIPGDQDDDDFEKLIVQRFDLALRKFITEVQDSQGNTIEKITNRAPNFTIQDGKYVYEQTKEPPVDVANSNIVIYTLRIFNEGTLDGYATKVKDDIPEELEFLPENSVNTAFNWKMYKEDGTETKNVTEAKYIETDFLSKDKETKAGSNLLKAFNYDKDKMTQPDHKDLQIAFKVTEPNTSDRIIVNKAQISEDSDKDGNPIDDADSYPDKWNEGEDDQDTEKIKVKYFDLSLKKWVTESIVTFNGKTTRKKSGHTGEENPEAPMKVEIRRRNISKTTVKFKYNIKVTNEGEIAGYAKEIIDYIPEGLKFVAKDNPKWKEVDGKVTTDQLKDTLLQPGESATVEITLTWINGEKNMGQKDNWAEISKDENEYHSPDIDSTPGNNVKGEDDIDVAPVLLSPSTGKTTSYIALVMTSVSMLAGGIFLIKKFVI